MIGSEEIYVLNKKVRLLQPDEGFRTSLDSVMLAAACPAKSGACVLDIGCGVGSASFCLLERVPGARVTGVEIQPDYVELAQRNIALNPSPRHPRDMAQPRVGGGNPEKSAAQTRSDIMDPVRANSSSANANGMTKERISFICSDIRGFRSDQRFDHVICNPPYMESGHHIPSPHEGLATARGHGEEDISLKDWLDCGFNNLKSRGSITIIHRADSTDRIIQAMGKRFGAIEIIPLWPKQGRQAKRVIIRAIKDRSSPSILHPGLILHDSDGAYTEEADNILRRAQPLL